MKKTLITLFTLVLSFSYLAMSQHSNVLGAKRIPSSSQNGDEPYEEAGTTLSGHSNLCDKTFTTTSFAKLSLSEAFTPCAGMSLFEKFTFNSPNKCVGVVVKLPNCSESWCEKILGSNITPSCKVVTKNNCDCRP